VHKQLLSNAELNTGVGLILFKSNILDVGANIQLRAGHVMKLSRTYFRRRQILNYENPLRGACGSVVVKALCYKPEGRGFDTR
jgi:hypothetical protein